MPEKVSEWTVTATGVGQRDYAVGVEYSAEPVIMSYQSVYTYSESISVSAGEDEVIDIEVPSENVVIIYDFSASVPSNLLVEMRIDIVDIEGVATTAIDKISYQMVEAHPTKGVPFFHIIRFVVHNYSDEGIDYMRINCAGLYTSLERYYIAKM